MTFLEQSRPAQKSTRRSFLARCAAALAVVGYRWERPAATAGAATPGSSGAGRSPDRSSDKNTSVRAIRSVFVAPLAAGDSGEAVRRQMLHDLAQTRDVHLVSAAAEADATLSIRSVFWRSGQVTVNPRAPENSYATYQGYASAELYDSARQPLWSYLATPSRFSFSGLAADLARQLSDSLIAALRGGMVATGAGIGAGAASAGSITLHAAGATFPAPLYRRWFESFADQAGGFAVHYDAIGSSEGLKHLAAGQVALAASDIPPANPTPESPTQDKQALPEPNMIRVATVVGGVVPIYNLSGVNPSGAGRELRLTGPVLAAIYAGTIKRWNDPRIREWNKATHLPDAEIVVVHRADGSGTTFVWTSYLASAGPEWQSGGGSDRIGASIDWPTGLGATGNEGVAELVQKTPNSIGYTELTYAIQHQLAYAAVRNPSGSFIQADLPSLTAAAASARASGRPAEGSLLNTPASDAYPIATYTWLLAGRAGADPQQRAALSRLLRWVLTSGQRQCSALAYAPLPREVAGEELRRVQSWQ